jgi:hypothetical protein
VDRPTSIDQIRNARDTALAALESAIQAISRKIELSAGPDAALNSQLDALMNQREVIETAATDAVLALPAVIAAAATLNALSTQMRITAQELPAATNVLTKAAVVSALGQQFSQVIALTTDGGSGQSIDPVDPWPRR